MSAHTRGRLSAPATSSAIWAAFDAAPIGVAVVDGSGHFLAVNPAMCALTGRDAGSLVGAWYLDPVHPDDWDADLAQAQRVLTGEIDGYHLDQRICRPDGDLRWVRARIRVERDDGGDPVRFVAMLVDVTDERAAWVARIRSEERYRDLIDSQPGLGVTLYDLDLRVISAGGPAFTEAGLDPGSLQGWRAEDVYPAADGAHVLPVLRAAVEGTAGSVEYRTTDGGHTFSLEVRPVGEGDHRRILVVATDISALRTAGRAAQATEEAFRAGADMSPTAVAEVDLRGRYLRVNPAMCALFGRTRDELIGASLIELSAPDDRDAARRAVEAMAAGTLSRREVDKRYLRPDGTEFWVTTKALVIPGADGRPDRFLVHYVDVDERVRDREALAASEDRARRLADLSPDGVVVADRAGRILYANLAYAALTGLTDADLAAGAVLAEAAASDVDQRSAPAAARWRAVLDGATVRSSREPLAGAGGATTTVEVSSAPMDYGGEPAVLSVVRDVTERDAQEEALAELRERHRLSFERAPIGQALVGLDGAWLAVNPALCRLLGLEADRLLAMNFRDVTHPDDLESDLALARSAAAGEIPGYSLEKRYVRPDGSVVNVLLHVVVVRDDAGAPIYFLSQIEDVTDQRRQEVRLRQISEELRWANESLQDAMDTALAGEARYRTLVDHLPDTVAYLYDRDHRLTMASEADPAERGFPGDDLVGKTPDELLEPPDARFVNRLLAEALEGRPTTTEITVPATGRHQLVDVVAIDTPGVPAEVLIVGRDITDRKAKEDALAAAHARYAALVEHSADLTMISDRAGLLTYVSPAWATLLGRDPVEAVGTPILSLVHPDDVARTRPERAELVTTPGAVAHVSLRVRHVDGRWRHVEVVMSNRLDDPAIGGIITNARDVTERVEAAAQLAHQATHDPLTDLPNRALFLDRMAQAMARAERTGTSAAVLYLDLDRFKGINDSLGHGAGDQVLVAVAGRLQSVLRAADTVSRFGGDEFVVLVESVARPQHAIGLAECMRRAITAPIDLGTTTVTVGCSVGIAISDGHRPEDLVQEADIALYRAKERGRNRTELYDHAMHSAARTRHRTEQLVRAALEDDSLYVLFQPVVDLQTGAVTGAEALARIRLPGGEVLGATEIIPVAEDTGLIVPLGVKVLDLACAQQAAWSSRPGGPRIIAVNVSARQLLSATFVGDVADTLRRHRLEPASLSLELTESALIDAGPSVEGNLAELRQLGVSLAIDDFGTGWSSLAYLRRFPLDAVKIDRSFVSGLGTDDGDTEVVRAIISLGRALNLATIAEGVETEGQESLLRSFGCDHAQGYRYGRPADAAAIVPR